MPCDGQHARCRLRCCSIAPDRVVETVALSRGLCWWTLRTSSRDWTAWGMASTPASKQRTLQRPCAQLPASTRSGGMLSVPNVRAPSGLSYRSRQTVLFVFRSKRRPLCKCGCSLKDKFLDRRLRKDQVVWHKHHTSVPLGCARRRRGSLEHREGSGSRLRRDSHNLRPLKGHGRPGRSRTSRREWPGQQPERLTPT